MHRHRYHGVLAPNAKLRAAVVAIRRPYVEEPDLGLLDPTPLSRPSGNVGPARPANPARIRWALLLARIYGVLPLLCPACGGPMRILAFLTDPPIVSAILLHLELHHEPPPISPARGPRAPREAWSGDFVFDQTPAFDPADAEPVPDFVFDQSLPDEFGD